MNIFQLRSNLASKLIFYKPFIDFNDIKKFRSTLWFKLEFLQTVIKYMESSM